MPDPADYADCWFALGCHLAMHQYVWVKYTDLTVTSLEWLVRGIIRKWPQVSGYNLLRIFVAQGNASMNWSSCNQPEIHKLDPKKAREARRALRRGPNLVIGWTRGNII